MVQIILMAIYSHYKRKHGSKSCALDLLCHLVWFSVSLGECLRVSHRGLSLGRLLASGEPESCSGSRRVADWLYLRREHGIVFWPQHWFLLWFCEYLRSFQFRTVVFLVAWEQKWRPSWSKKSKNWYLKIMPVGWGVGSHPWSSFFLWSCMLMMVSVVFKIWLTINGDIFHFKYFCFSVFYFPCSFSFKEKNRSFDSCFPVSYKLPLPKFLYFLLLSVEGRIFFFFCIVKRFGSLVPGWFHFQLSDLCLNFHAFKTGPLILLLMWSVGPYEIAISYKAKHRKQWQFHLMQLRLIFFLLRKTEQLLINKVFLKI